ISTNSGVRCLAVLPMVLPSASRVRRQPLSAPAIVARPPPGSRRHPPCRQTLAHASAVADGAPVSLSEFPRPSLKATRLAAPPHPGCRHFRELRSRERLWFLAVGPVAQPPRRWRRQSRLSLSELREEGPIRLGDRP